MRFVASICVVLVFYSHVYAIEDKVADDGYCSADGCDSESQLHSETSLDSDINHPPTEINVVITFYNAVSNLKLIKTFTKTVSSMLDYSSVPLAIHILGDNDSQKLASKIVSENCSDKKKYRVCMFHK